MSFSLSLAFVAFAVVALAVHAPQQQGVPVVLFAPASFDTALSGWERSGEASFACDQQMMHDGRASARILIGPGLPLAYQQLKKDFSRDIQEGDELRASVWVRSEGVDQDPGAYLALEFVAPDGSRAAIAHSRTSASNGSRGWDRLEAIGSVPAGCSLVRISLILHAHGTAWFSGPSLERLSRASPWPDLGDGPRKIVVKSDAVAQPNFQGVGFHAFHHVFPATQQDLDEVIYKRWRELNPSFVRLNDQWDYDRTMMEQIADHMARMKQTGTEIYLTSWNPPDVKDDAALGAWAARVADNLEFYRRTRGLTNVRTYCMTNELSLGGWGSLVNDLPRFRKYHQALFDELKKRKLDVGLLATDASPVGYWHTIEWAARNMDEITAIYGGHEYFNDRGPEDERFYPWFLGKLEWAVGIARAKGKNFILGEFGAKQDGRTLNGVRQDRCIYFETPTEPLVTLQLAEAAIAAINAGVYGMGYWTYMDFPDDYRGTYINKWGTFRCSGSDRSTRAIYYGYGLMTRYFRGPATAYRMDCDDPRVRAAAVRHRSGTWSVAVVNRNARPVRVAITLPDSAGSVRMRRYTYNPASVKHHPFGDLPGPDGAATMRAGKLSDTVAGMTLTVYTSAYDDTPPSRVAGVSLDRSRSGVKITWQPVAAKDLCYYRVYRIVGNSRKQIGSTIATVMTDRDAPADARYAVTAVDMSGNEGPG
jgi:hypothetical protein